MKRYGQLTYLVGKEKGGRYYVYPRNGRPMKYYKDNKTALKEASKLEGIPIKEYLKQRKEDNEQVNT